MEEQYKIGDISKKLGISRDTLRFYEKKGMIHPKKEENGYRYYTCKDVRILLDILFFRKYDFSLEEIYQLLNHSTYEGFIDKIQQKIEEETAWLEQKKRSLLNLSLNREIISRAEHYTGLYEIQDFPEFCLLKEGALTENNQVLELCYLYDEYELTSEGTKLTGQYMLVPGLGVSGLDISLSEEENLKSPCRHCVYTVVESDSYSPSCEQLEIVVSWANDCGFTLDGKVYAGYLVHCVKDGKQVYYIELYLPVR